MEDRLGPGKTAPRLLEDILQFDPRKEKDRGYNVLTQPPPPFDGSDIATEPKGSCRHSLFLNLSQSKLPETVEELSSAGVYKVAAYCQICRQHVDIIVDTSHSERFTKLCPAEGFPLHHFIWLQEGHDGGTGVRTGSTPPGWHKFRCSAPQCNTFVSIQYRPPRLSPEFVRLLTNRELLKQRYMRCSRYHPGRAELKNPVDALDILRIYLRDALAPNNSRSKIPLQNKAFMAVFGDDCDELLKFLGFSVVHEGADDGFWFMPKVTAPTDPLGEDSLRRRLEDVMEELTALIKTVIAPSDERRNLKALLQPPLPALKEIARCLNCLDYDRSPDSRTVDLTAPEHPYYAGLGVVADVSDELLLFAHRRQSDCDPSSGPYYFECLNGLANGRQSSELQMRAAILASEGHFSRQDVTDAYGYFAIDRKHVDVLTDEHIIGMFNSRLPDLGRGQEHEAREKLRIIGHARTSQAILHAASANEVNSYEQALSWLGAEPDTPDEFIPTILAVKTGEAVGAEDIGRKAIDIIATHRNSEYLRNWLRSGEGSTDDDLAQACNLLGITDRSTAPDLPTLKVYIDALILESPEREEELRRAAAVITKAVESGSYGDTSATEIAMAQHPTGEWPVGLRNIGNTCYLNSLLQYCFTIVPLRDIVQRFDDYRMPITEENLRSKKVGQRQVTRKEVERSQKFVEELAGLFKEMMTNPARVVVPRVELACLTLVSQEREEEFKAKSPIASRGRLLSLGTIAGQTVMGPLPQPPLLNTDITPKTIASTEKNNAGYTSSNDTLVDESTSPMTPEEVPNVKDPKSPSTSASSTSSVKRKWEGDDTEETIRYSPPKRTQERDDSVGSTQETVVHRRDSMDMNVDTEQDATANDDAASTKLPSKPSRPPPVPPRNKKPAPAPIQTGDLEDAAFAARQQDVTEVIDNVVFQLQCAIRAESQDATGEQLDSIKSLFFGTQANTYMKKSGTETTEELFSNLIVNVADGPRSIYSALDNIFDPDEVDIEGQKVAKVSTITTLPPVLQIFVQRLGFDRETNSQFKVEHQLDLKETIDLGRYMTSTDPVLEARRKESWRLKSELKRLDIRKKQMGDALFLELDAGEALTGVYSYLNTIKIQTSDDDEEENDVVDGETQTQSLLPANENDGPHPIFGLIQEECLVLQQDMDEVTKEIKAIEAELEPLFDDLQTDPYRLYALFIHRGNAQGGHYWVYIRDFDTNTWRQYNDETVTEVLDTKLIFEQDDVRPATPYFVVYVRDSQRENLVGPVMRVLEMGVEVEEETNGFMQGGDTDSAIGDVSGYKSVVPMGNMRDHENRVHDIEMVDNDRFQVLEGYEPAAMEE